MIRFILSEGSDIQMIDNLSIAFNDLSMRNMLFTIYTYIYICVCVCVRARTRACVCM